MNTIINGLMLPFLGTAAGATLVFFLKKDLSPRVRRSFEGFAGGVMIYACFCSLVLPALEYSSGLGILSFLPVSIGIWFGTIFLLLSDRFTENASGNRLFLAVTLHNIPEGMAVGVSIAEAIVGGSEGASAAAVTLSLGIALQNLPEGAIVALPTRAKGGSRIKAFWLGLFSGAAELASAVVTLIFTSAFTAILPVFLGIACGCMLYVTLEELVGEKSRESTLFFVVGFTVMLIISAVAG